MRTTTRHVMYHSDIVNTPADTNSACDKQVLRQLQASQDILKLWQKGDACSVYSLPSLKGCFLWALHHSLSLVYV